MVAICIYINYIYNMINFKAQEKIKNDLDISKVTLDVYNSSNLVSMHDSYNSGGSQGLVGIIKTTQSCQGELKALGKTDVVSGSPLINLRRVALGCYFPILTTSTGDKIA